jgi:hypothetical protein
MLSIIKAFPWTVRQTKKLVKFVECYESIPTDSQTNIEISKICRAYVDYMKAFPQTVRQIWKLVKYVEHLLSIMKVHRQSDK